MKLMLSFLISCLVNKVANSAPFAHNSGIDDVGEFGKHFEGDMILTTEQEKLIKEAQNSRNGLRSTAKRWPNNTVVYDIEKDDFINIQLKQIEEAMQDISNKSCIQFRPKQTPMEPAVTIQGSASGCYSNVGYNKPKNNGSSSQTLNLAKGCFKHGTIVHEILHTIGFYHMQSTYDRDNFVVIVWENIQSGSEHNFAKYNNNTVTDFGVAYDYGSVMHYPEVSFSKNGNKTIVPLQDNVSIGQRIGMSDSDVKKLNKMYCK